MTEAEKALTALERNTAHSKAIKAGIQQSMQAGKPSGWRGCRA